MRIRLTKQAANSVDKASCVSGRVLRLLIRSTLEAANPVRNSAGIDNEAASSMTRVAEDDETQRNKQKPIGVSQFTKNFDVWEFGTVLRTFYTGGITAKITGMPLRIDNMKLILLWESLASFAAKVEEVVKVLKLFNRTNCCQRSHSRQKDLKATVKNHRHVKIKIRKVDHFRNAFAESALVESASHIFFSCSLALQVRSKLMCWWELDNHVIHPYEDWFCRFNGLRMSKRLKEVFEDVCYVMSWLLWRFKNLVIFGEKLP
ncbi:RNA-directed DNA polymerase, eukaryota [Tanacetum coccineum]